MLGVTLLFASYTHFRKQRPESYERLQALLENWGEYYKPIGYILLTRQTAPVRVTRNANRSLPYRPMADMEAFKLPANLDSYGKRDSEKGRSLPGIRVITPKWELARKCADNIVPEKWPWGGEQRGRQRSARDCLPAAGEMKAALRPERPRLPPVRSRTPSTCTPGVGTTAPR